MFFGAIVSFRNRRSPVVHRGFFWPDEGFLKVA